MMCPSVFPLPSGTMRPFLDVHWPVRSLWPETRPLFYHMEQEVLRHLQEMRQSVEYMERLHQRIFDEIDHTASSTTIFAPIAFQRLGNDSGGFAVSLDAAEFSPKELSVHQVGRKLRVSGRAERKQEDQQGSSSYRCQEFRQEFLLPDSVRPDDVTCSLVGGRLEIRAPPEVVLHDGKERVVPISVASAPAISSSSTSSSGTSSSSQSESTAAEKN